MNGKGDRRRPTGKGLYDRDAEIVSLNQQIFWEKDSEKKSELIRQLEKLKEELYGE